MDAYIHYGEGPHKCLGMEVSKVAITAMLKTVGRLDNLRRAPGPRGELKKIPRPGGFYIYMKEDESGYFPFPTSKSTQHRSVNRVLIVDTAMRINWDGELAPLPMMD